MQCSEMDFWGVDQTHYLLKQMWRERGGKRSPGGLLAFGLSSWGGDDWDGKGFCGREIRLSGWLSPRNLRLDKTRPRGAGR